MHGACATQLLFDIFDVDKRGKVTMAELDAMIRMLHGSPDADPELLRMLAVNGSADEDALAFEEFLQVWSPSFSSLVGVVIDRARASSQKRSVSVSCGIVGCKMCLLDAGLRAFRLRCSCCWYSLASVGLLSSSAWVLDVRYGCL